MKRSAGVTLVEILTVLVALVVVIAVAVPLWRTHQLRAQRSEAMKALLAVQTAEDHHFGEHARYADAARLEFKRAIRRYTLELKLSDDQLGYIATAVATKAAGAAFDARCARLSIDQHGRRSAFDDAGEDSTADCWERK